MIVFLLIWFSSSSLVESLNEQQRVNLSFLVYTLHVDFSGNNASFLLFVDFIFFYCEDLVILFCVRNNNVMRQSQTKLTPVM